MIYCTTVPHTCLLDLQWSLFTLRYSEKIRQQRPLFQIVCQRNPAGFSFASSTCRGTSRQGFFCFSTPTLFQPPEENNDEHHQHISLRPVSNCPWSNLFFLMINSYFYLAACIKTVNVSLSPECKEIWKRSKYAQFVEWSAIVSQSEVLI